MRKIIYFCTLFAVLCIFSGKTTKECSAKSLEEKNIYIYLEDFIEEIRSETVCRTNFKTAKIAYTTIKEYKKPILLPELRDLDLELDFRVQSPRMNTDEEVRQNGCFILY